VLWQSLFVDSTTWNLLVAPLAPERRLVIIEGPDHGGSPPVRHPFTLDDRAGAAVDVLDHLGIREPVNWVGNAWSGQAGTLFAAAHPDRCLSLIALGAPVRTRSDADRRGSGCCAGVPDAGSGPMINPARRCAARPEGPRRGPELRRSSLARSAPSVAACSTDRLAWPPPPGPHPTTRPTADADAADQQTRTPRR
jgi:pimeloyl-ACP methyl ester carboxylesterase